MPTTITKITPGTFSAGGTYTVRYLSGASNAELGKSRTAGVSLHDNGTGDIYLTETDGSQVLYGAIDYETGQVFLQSFVNAADVHDAYGPFITAGEKILKWNEFVAQAASLGQSPYRQLFLSNWADTTIAPVTPGGPTVPAVPPALTVEMGDLIASVTVDRLFAKVFTVANYTLKGASFTLGADNYMQTTAGVLLKNPSPTTGGGTPAGTVSGATGVVTIQSWTAGGAPTLTNWRGLIAPPSVGAEAPFTGYATTFRTATSPLRPASLSVLGTMQDGTTFNLTADANGKINGTRVKGRVDYQYGLVELYFVNPDGNAALNKDLGFLSIAGVGVMPADLVMLGSLRYNAVGFSYLPLDADLLGIDPVRLPSDGRVPIFRAGGFAVLGHTGAITATVSNAQVINCARVRLSRVRVIGHNGVVITTGYTPDLEAGTVTFNDVTGYSQPVTIEHRIEDMAVVRDVQISGELSFTRPITHDYPLGSYISSALISGDLKARVSHLFDQATWSGSSWLDTVSGAAATGTYNDVISPIGITNKGAVSERWSLVFTNTTSFNIVGEHVGVIGTGTINADCAPINPATGVPYFTVPAAGWGLGWAVGNVLRLNTVGAMCPVWVVRTVQQGPNTGTEHSFTLLSRGDVDRT